MPKLALITGASSGIGQAYAERLAADDFDLIVVGRRRARLEALKASLSDVTVEPLPADLATDDGTQPSVMSAPPGRSRCSSTTPG